MSLNTFINTYGAKLLIAIITHLKYVFISVSIGFIIAMVLAIILSRYPKYSKIVIPILGVFQTIPGVIFIGLLFLITGMKEITVIIALSIYAI
ncbi:MAG: choline ABC transporter permease, partial [Bacilli bacterium]